MDSRTRIAELLRDQDFSPSILRALKAVDGARLGSGQSTGTDHNVRQRLSSDTEGAFADWRRAGCPLRYRARSPLLPPALIHDRIRYLRNQWPCAVVSHYEAERARLVQFLSEEDYYRKWCADPTDDGEREQKKVFLNILLHLPNAKCKPNGLYIRMRRTFPLTFGICEDIKRKDHRNLSKSLQYCTAKVINGALLEAQANGIAAIPDVDAIIVRRQKETLCISERKFMGYRTGSAARSAGFAIDPLRRGPQRQLVLPLSLRPNCSRLRGIAWQQDWKSMKGETETRNDESWMR